MTRIDFYILAQASRGNRHLLACRLSEKAFRQRHRVYIHTTSMEEAQHLDRLLWTFREGSFVPHGLSGEADAEFTPILIGCRDAPGDEDDVLINLAREVPSFFSRFERVAELIDQEAAVRASGRKRYCFYRDRGYPLYSHDLAL